MVQVSVIMAAYNGMPFLPEAVESILNQTLADLELIVVNDGSTDGSGDYLHTVADPRFELLELQTNGGQGAARNRAIARSRGEYIAIMDGDDVSLPDRLAKQVRFLSDHDHIGLVGTQFAYIGTGGRRGFRAPIPLDHEQIYSELLQGRHGFVHASMMCRRSILQEVGGYRIDGCGEDFDLLLRMGEVARMANLPDVLYLYRVHPQSSNIVRLAEIRRRFAYSAQCARCRALGREEPSFESFCDAENVKPAWNRFSSRCKQVALLQYKQAIGEILSDHQVKGYLRLGLAALVSPGWTWQRLSREVRTRIRRARQGGGGKRG